jgi:hypothetical protein
MPTQTPEQEMTLAEAVAVLNERRHRGFDDLFPGWEVMTDSAAGPYVRAIPARCKYFSAFEAIAIAEKYERLRARETPERERTADEFSDGIDRKAAVANRG